MSSFNVFPPLLYPYNVELSFAGSGTVCIVNHVSLGIKRKRGSYWYICQFLLKVCMSTHFVTKMV